jgi:hypothetical protein
MTSARAYQTFVKKFKLCSLQKEAGTTARINHFVAIRVIREPRSFMIELFCGRLKAEETSWLQVSRFKE